MSKHTATIRWDRSGIGFDYETYSRDHDWRFDGGVVVGASSAPKLRGNPARVDPEEAYVASLSSCHMLWFLHLACQAGLVVDRYEDTPEGVLERDPAGVAWVTRCVLRPHVVFSGDRIPTEDTVRDLHDQAHANCFIANSVKTDIQHAGGFEHAGDSSQSG